MKMSIMLMDIMLMKMKLILTCNEYGYADEDSLIMYVGRWISLVRV